MKRAIRDPRRLCEVLGLSELLAKSALVASRQFPLFAPLEYVARMEHRNPRDPLLRQVLPLDCENIRVEGFVADPVEDASAKTTEALLQK